MWLHKFLSGFGSHAVFLVGVGVAAGMAMGAWRVVRAEKNLPEEAPDAGLVEGRSA